MSLVPAELRDIVHRSSLNKCAVPHGAPAAVCLRAHELDHRAAHADYGEQPRSIQMTETEGVLPPVHNMIAS
jgi:hypothetical protein